MSQSKMDDDHESDSPPILVISDSEISCDELTGFSSPQKRCMAAPDPRWESALVKKKPKVDSGEREYEEPPIDIDSVSTNPLRARNKVSSDTSSKFPVSSPSDTVPQAGHRKKYVKNTLPAGDEWRMLQDIALGHPAITFMEKAERWVCCDELSDVEDVNNFDSELQKREKLYSKCLSSRRGSVKDSPYPNYNYHHFRSVILETLRGSPISSSQESNKQSPCKPSCSKKTVEVAAANANSTENSAPMKPNSSHMTIYEKILCPSSESSATKASPSIRLHWTDEESVFRCNRLNPEIDKYSQLIKVRIDYNKQIDFKSKIGEIFKTPSVPVKYNSGPMETLAPSAAGDSVGRKSLDTTISSSIDTKPIDEQSVGVENLRTRRSSSRQRSLDRKNSGQRRSTDRKSSGRRSSDRRSNERRSSERFPELSCFQQDEFCNYLGLGVNGKVYSPTPTDSKRRSLRVKRYLVPLEKSTEKKKVNEKKKELKKKEKTEEDKGEDSQEVSTTDDNERCSVPVPTITREEETVIHKSPIPLPAIPSTNLLAIKTPEIKIITQLRSTAATPTRSVNTPSSVTTVNSTPPPTANRRQRRTRATSNGTSTCPRSSQSDDSPEKTAIPPRRRRLKHHIDQEQQEKHCELNDRATSDFTESLQDDHITELPQHRHNGRTSTIPSSSEGKQEHEPEDLKDDEDDPQCVHKKYQRYLEESRKTKPSIFILESISNNDFKPSLMATQPKNNQTSDDNTAVVVPNQQHTTKEKKVSCQSNKRVLRHLLRRRRNGTIIGTLNQRMLRNRTVTRSSRSTIKKHHPTVKVMRKNIIRMAQQQEASKKIDNTRTEPKTSQKQNKASQIDFLVVETKKKVQSSFVQVPDPLALPSPPTVQKHESSVQTDPYVPPLPIAFLTSPSDRMPNPLTPENGRVIYAYFELDILTIVQDFMVTFWKTCKLIQVIGNEGEEWTKLGECKRLLHDTEIETPYKNRICVHNSIPIYLEMRAKEMPKLNRECVLISVYVNVYYFDDEDLLAKSHSIQLDSVASFPRNVVYTTITDSRYFVMCWSQETPIGKTLSGLCKYSLTPHLDTLASIREFKSMRHEIRYLECTTDDNLIGFGDSQVTLWDHRSGDILMNYDLEMEIGRNLGSLHFAPLEVGQAKTIIIFQHTAAQELSIIAINVSHNSPSHQLVCKHTLPAEFENLLTTMAIDDYTILANAEHQELWIDHSDPQYTVQVRTPEGERRFYSRSKQSVVVITENHLALETFSSFVLKLSNYSENVM